jgi:hypothetical protein
VGSKRRPPGPIGDVAVVCGKDADGLHILRRRSKDGPVEAAIAKPLTEGRPITGEVISMRRRRDLPFLFDVKTEIDISGERAEIEGAAEAPTEAPTIDGPAKVATNSYRQGWDAIWGSRTRGPAN